MNERELLPLLSELKKTSETTCIKGLEILSKLKKTDGDIFEDVAYATNKKVSDVVDDCRKYALELVDDARKVSQEIGNFLVRKNNGISISDDKNMFLVEVWSGDVYGEFEDDALRYLLKDIRESLKNLSSEDNFVTYCAQKIVNPENS